MSKRYWTERQTHDSLLAEQTVGEHTPFDAPGREASSTEVGIRARCGGLGVELAAPRVTDATLDAAEALCDRMTKESDPSNWAELNRRFHFLFHDATGAPRLAAILRGLEDAATLYVAQAQRLHPEIRRRANAAHRAFVDACRDGAHEAAQRAMLGHAGVVGADRGARGSFR